ncbi:MAG: hypothetical protein WAN65_09495 [Candidatus Sulfotelmatobacter sp.]
MAVWSTVGSVGVASAADQTKLVLYGSVVQLGFGTGVVNINTNTLEAKRRADPGTSPAVPALMGTQQTAVMRYGVDVPENSLALGTNGMRIRYRDGDGFVLAKLIAVDIDTGVESVLLGFDSAGSSNSNSFQTGGGLTFEGGPLPPLSTHTAFYIELTLSVFQRVALPVGFPPAVSAIELGVEGLVFATTQLAVKDE